jgi:hypothetical protein
MISDTLKKLEHLTDSFKFGHTPIQIEYFQTSNQQGNEKWEYWQHILQLRSLYTTLSDLTISYNETEYELEDAESLWPIWSIKKRQRTTPRIKFKLKGIIRSLEEKEREVIYHLDVIEKKYSHLKTLTEEEILKDEASYWTLRLGRQLGASHLGKLLGISDGELLAVLSLPKDKQLQVFEGMRQLLGMTIPMLPRKE